MNRLNTHRKWKRTPLPGVAKTCYRKACFTMLNQASHRLTQALREALSITATLVIRRTVLRAPVARSYNQKHQTTILASVFKRYA